MSAALFAVDAVDDRARVEAEVDRLLARRHATQPLDVPSAARCSAIRRATSPDD